MQRSRHPQPPAQRRRGPVQYMCLHMQQQYMPTTWSANTHTRCPDALGVWPGVQWHSRRSCPLSHRSGSRPFGPVSLVIANNLAGQLQSGRTHVVHACALVCEVCPVCYAGWVGARRGMQAEPKAEGRGPLRPRRALRVYPPSLSFRDLNPTITLIPLTHSSPEQEPRLSSYHSPRESPPHQSTLFVVQAH